MALPSECEVSVKIVIQSHTDAVMISGHLENVCVFVLGHSKFHHVNGVQSAVSQDLRREAQVPGPAARQSCHPIDAQTFLINDCGCIAQHLVEIFRLQEWVLCNERDTIRVRGHQFQHTPHGDAHSSDARFATAFSRLHCNAIERLPPRGSEIAISAIAVRNHNLGGIPGVRQGVRPTYAGREACPL